MGSEATQAIGQGSPLTAVQYVLSSQQRYLSGVLAAGSQPPKTKGPSHYYVMTMVCDLTLSHVHAHT
jgi:hypothetical protein